MDDWSFNVYLRNTEEKSAQYKFRKGKIGDET